MMHEADCEDPDWLRLEEPRRYQFVLSDMIEDSIHLELARSLNDTLKFRQRCEVGHLVGADGVAEP
jgi:hypothetical protein